MTASLGGWYIQGGTGIRETWEERWTRAMLACDAAQAPFLVLDPLAAEGFIRRGLGDKAALREWLADASRTQARVYWDNQELQTVVRWQALAGVEPYASRLKAAPDELVRTFEPDAIEIAVVGGETQPSWRVFGSVLTVTESVDDWR